MRSSKSQIKHLQSSNQAKLQVNCIPLKKFNEAVEEALKTVLAETKTVKKAAERKKAVKTSEKTRVKLLPEATQALQVAAEDHLTRWMVQLTLLANHAGRKEQSDKDQTVLNKLAQTTGGWPQI